MCYRVFDQFGESINPAVVGQGAHLNTGINSVTHHRLRGAFNKLPGVVIKNTFVHKEARGRGTNLPGVTHFAHCTREGRCFNISVFANDHRRVAAQLHQYRGHVLRCQNRQMPSDYCRASKGNQSYLLVGNQVL